MGDDLSALQNRVLAAESMAALESEARQEASQRALAAEQQFNAQNAELISLREENLRQRQEIEALAAAARSGRKKRRVEKTGPKESLKKNVAEFVQTKLRSADKDAFLSTNQLLAAFSAEGHELLHGHVQLFFKELKACIAKDLPGALEKRTWSKRGYCGVEFLQDV